MLIYDLYSHIKCVTRMTNESTNKQKKKLIDIKSRWIKGHQKDIKMTKCNHQTNTYNNTYTNAIIDVHTNTNRLKSTNIEQRIH